MKWNLLYIFFGILLGFSGYLTAYTSFVFFPIKSLLISFILSYIVTITIYFVIRTPITYEKNELIYVGNVGALTYLIMSLVIKKIIDGSAYSILSFQTSYVTLFLAAFFFSVSFIITGFIINIVFTKAKEDMFF